MTIGCSVFPSILRARIDGAVMRLPGTGDGVALLVLVSIVKVDMPAASSDPSHDGPARARFASETPGTLRYCRSSDCQVREAFRVSRVTTETIMIYSH